MPKALQPAPMAKKSAGDWRDRDQVHRWVTTIVSDLKHSEEVS
jgi:hypothetical protein